MFMNRFQIFDQIDASSGRAATAIGLESFESAQKILAELDLLIVRQSEEVCFLGGLFRQTSVSGLGSNPISALARLQGEVAEVAALENYRCKPAREHNLDLAAAWSHLPYSRLRSWLEANNLATMELTAVPSGLLSRDSMPRSEGCAAHQSVQAACLHGLAELIERDALTLWWAGGRRGRLLDDSSVSEERETIIIDISTDLPGVAIAAVSFELDGSRFACGTAAAPDRTGAIRAAKRELRQMEFSLDLIAMKESEIGPEALTDQDSLQKERSLAIDRSRFVRATISGPAEEEFISAPTDPVDWAEALSGHGIQILDVPLGAYFDLSVRKIISPQLQSSNPAVSTVRLEKTIRSTGGADDVLRIWPVL